MTDSLESIKSLRDSYLRWADASEKEGENPRARRQKKSADDLSAIIDELERARARLRPLDTDLGDLSDLPEKVMAQLSLTKVDELEQQMRDIVASGNGSEVSLDTIIIELYRRHKGIYERKFIMNKLYRMSQKGTIVSVEGKKGMYCVPMPSTAEWEIPF